MPSFEEAIGWRLPQFRRSFRVVWPLVLAFRFLRWVQWVPGHLVPDSGGPAGNLLLWLSFLRKMSGAAGCSGRGMSSGGMVREVSLSTGGVGAKGGEAGRKIPVGRVGRRVGMAGEGVRRWEPEIRW